MPQARSKSIPLPAALLALSVAVCLGAAGPVEASALRGAGPSQSEQRETFESLIEAIQLAAKRLTDRLDGQFAFVRADTARFAVDEISCTFSSAARPVRIETLLREALLSLPPPSC